MDWNNEKCVMVLEEGLPLGVIANTAAILGITLGKELPEAVGMDAIDGSGSIHKGIIAFPVPILKGTAEQIREIRTRLAQVEFADVTCVDFSDLAQSCMTYEDFLGKMAEMQEESLRYLGIALCGEKKKINRLTGSLPLLR